MPCAVVDHQMPGLTGLQMVERMRARGTALPVMLITAAPSSAIFARAVELGVAPVLMKPPDDDQIIALINAAMPPMA